MASPVLRKSSRIKTRKKIFSPDDDKDYDPITFDYDISQNISTLLDFHSKEKDANRSEQSSSGFFPDVARKSQKKEKAFDSKSSKADWCEMSHANLDANEQFTDQNSQEKVGYSSEQLSKGKSGKEFSCDHCGKIFTDLTAFKRHLRGHAGERPYRCDLCEKSFVESCSLKRHMKTHEDDRPFTCDICLKSFRDSTSFNRHHLTHTERPRSFQCPSCEKSFTDKSGLKRHERSHTGLRPFQCDICHKTFSESGSFRRHQKIHMGIRNYHCPRCKRSFMEKQSLVRHQKTVCGFWESQDLSDSSHQESSSDHGNVQDHDTSGKNYQQLSSTLVSLDESSPHDVDMNSSKPVATGNNPVPAQKRVVRKMEGNNQKSSPSLGSLIQKDPNLYDRVSEIVDSIDSYEKMLDLCGDVGQKEIDAALTREPNPMPDNLMCFECGELLIDGENFSREGKSFPLNSNYSFRCLGCEEDIDEYGEPPILTAQETQEDVLLAEDETKFRVSTDNSMDSEFSDIPISTVSDTKVENCSAKSEIPYSEINHLKSEMKSISTYVNKNVDPMTMCSNSSEEYFSPRRDNQQIVKDSSLVGDNYLDSQAIPPLIPIEIPEPSHVLRDKPSGVEYEADDPSIPSVFPCHLCTKVFATSSFLDQHLDLHRKSPHKCMVCGKSFSGNPALKRHMRVHTGEKPYCCPLCSKKFRDPSNFSKHKKFCTVNEFAPSPIESSSSSTSGHSVDETSELFKRNMHGEHLSFKNEQISTSHLPTSPDAFIIESLNEETEDNLGQPVMVLPALIDDDDDDDGEEPPSEHDPTLAKNKMINYIPCEICQKLCESQDHLDMHMHYHNGDPNVTCIECGKSFSDSHGMKRHMRIHAESRPFVCEYCHRGYCDNWSLKKHKSRGCMNSEVRVPVDLLYPCQRCNRVFSDETLLEEHVKCHKGILKFECDICLKKFSEAFNLKRHRRLHMTICPGCGNEFKSIDEMARHQKECQVSTPSKPATDSTTSFPCPDCGRSYSTLAYLARHRKFHFSAKLYECDICSKKFSEAFKLRRHKQGHTESKPFICQECGKGFVDEAYLKRHVINSSCTISKSMRGAINFPCQFCDKVFTKNYMLVRHMNVHSQERPFSCDLCGRSYKDTSSLKRHQLVHQGNKDYICSVCGKEFFYADSLKRHLTGRCSNTSKSRKYHSKKAPRKNGVKITLQDSINYNNNNNNNNNNNKKGQRIRNKVVKDDIDIGCGDAVEIKAKLHTLPYRCRTMENKAKTLSVSHYNRVKKIKFGPWSCRNKKHCWHCDTKWPSRSAFKSHNRIHEHKKRFACLHCFARFSRKAYWKVHMSSFNGQCSNTASSESRSFGSSSSFNLKSSDTRLYATQNELSSEARKQDKKCLTVKSPKLSESVSPRSQRPRRSIPRTRWSWLSQI